MKHQIDLMFVVQERIQYLKEENLNDELELPSRLPKLPNDVFVVAENLSIQLLQNDVSF